MQPKKIPEADALPTHLERLARRIEATRIAEYVELLQKPRRLIITNFIAGVFRGLGFAIGTTIVFAIVVEVIRRAILMEIPFLNEYLLDLIRLIDLRR